MSVPETTSLLFEIGCEEIPARFLEGAQHDLGDRLAAALGDARLLVADSGVKTYSTPRRLVAFMPALLAMQPGRIEQVIGPPVKAAFDREGKPTRTAESFAAKKKAKLSELKRVTTAKGEYLALDIAESGETIIKVLHEVLPAVLSSLTLPKNMYWTAKAGPFFIRPIRWILALLGEGSEAQVVPFEFAGVRSGQNTFGHRLKGSEPIRVTGFNDYMKKLREDWVEPEPAVRRQRTKQGIKALLEDSHSKAVADEWLESWVVNSTEWPVPRMGGFDARYLALPREVLVTVMRDHQKYFAVEDEAGNLKPYFITVLNVTGDPKGLICQGHERVLAARFADAEFFWNADQKVRLYDRLPMLKDVVFQENIGNYEQKARRMELTARAIGAAIEGSQPGRLSPNGQQAAMDAALYSKCDLTTHMVQEFPELQGVVGGLLAKLQGAPDEEADAISEHYRPQGLDDKRPRTLIGAIVSLSDKLDNLIAGFFLGHSPTGSSDAFGMRRQGNGIVEVLLEYRISVNLKPIIDGIVAFLDRPDLRLNSPAADALAKKTIEFLRERAGFYLENIEGFQYDTVRAALFGLPPSDQWNVRPDEVVGLIARARAIHGLRGMPDLEALCIAAKRIRNLISKSGVGTSLGTRVEEVLFEDDAERNLFSALECVETEAARLAGERKYYEALVKISTLRPEVDQFFEHVMVMADDVALRENRLRMLGRLQQVFSALADLSQLSTEQSNVGAPTLKEARRPSATP